MLTIHSGRAPRDCSGVSRRDFLRVGALGMAAGLTLPRLLSTRALASQTGAVDYVRDKAVVLLYLSGGASHIETFNPNMDAPAPYHSLTGEVRTSLPGVAFGGTFPELARLAHKMAAASPSAWARMAARSRSTSASVSPAPSAPTRRKSRRLTPSQ